MTIGEIPIPIIQGELPVSTSMDRKPGQCFPKTTAIPSMLVKSANIREKIQFMTDHALLGKFIGLHPSKKALLWWINSTWKPKGHYDLHLGSKGFFTVSFISQEDQNRIIDGGPYFYYLAGLFLRPWKEKFCPEKEDMQIAPV